jgi:hypothetical protein
MSKHTSLISLVVYSLKLNFRYHDFCELRRDGVLGSLPLAAAVCPPGLYLPIGMDAGVRQRTMGPWVT